MAHPEKFGGKEDEGFDVIVPSLPGFGFSGRPSRPIGPRKISKIMNELVLTSKKQQKEWGEAGNIAAEKYLWENVTKEILELYSRILKN